MRILALLWVVFGGLLLSGCSMWGDELEVQPSPLPEFTAERKVAKLWSAQVGDGLGEKYNLLVPLIQGERIYASDLSGHVYAFDLSTGKRLWDVRLSLPVSGGLGGGHGKLLLATEKGQVVALDSESGEKLWQAKVPSEVLSPPQINGDLVLVQSIDGRLSALGAADGANRWTYSARQPNLTLRGTGTPLLSEQHSYAGFANGYLTAIDNRTGQQIWERRVALGQGQTELERVVDLDGALLLRDGVFYLTSYQGRVAAVAAYNGQVLWSKPLSSYQGLAAGGRSLFASDADGNVQAFDQESGASLWKQEALYFRQPGAPAVIGDAVAVGDYQGYIHFLSQADGRFLARYQADGDGVRSYLQSRDGVLYVLGNSGRLVALALN